MDSKDVKVLNKIVEHIDSIIEVTSDINDAEEFRNTNDKSKAALFDLLQIGELVQNGLSRDVIRELNTIPWEQIYALRNRIVHGYASVDYEIIWETVEKDIPALKTEIVTALGE